MIRPFRAALAFTLGLSLLGAAACRSDSGDDDGDDDVDVDAGGGGDTSIFDVQDPTDIVPIDGAVTLRGVVVLAKDTFGARKGNIFVGEPEGGAYSGVLVYGADLMQVDELEVGDLIDLTGAVKTEFALSDDTSGRTTTELQPADGGEINITKVGTGSVPAPSVVDAAALAGMEQGARDAEWEKWEGVLIEVQDTTVQSFVDQIGDDETFLEFTLEGDLHVDNSLAEIPAAADVTPGGCATIVGLGDYFFSHKVLPRATSDVALSGSGCASFAASTIAGVQAPSSPGVHWFDDVVVTAIANNRVQLWIADAAAGASSAGIYVYRGNSMTTPDLPEDVVPGTVLDIAGEVEVFEGLSELTYPSFRIVSASGTEPTPIDVTLATLLDAEDRVPYIGSLVRIQDVEVTAFDENGGFPTYTLTNGASSLQAEGTIYRHPAAVNDCYDTFVGIFSLNTFDDIPVILPRAAGDVGGGCI